MLASQFRQENARERMRGIASVCSPFSRLPTSRAPASLLRFPPASFLSLPLQTLSGGRPSVMNTTRNLIRSCSGSLTVQHLARRTAASSPRTQFLAVGSRRFYSEGANPSGQESEGGSKDPDSSKTESELSKQLAAKEEEVADLKVCLFLRDRWLR